MFSRARSKDTEGGATASVQKSSVPSIISADLRITGNLESDGDIQIDGTVDGDIRSGRITVSETAVVKGALEAETVRIAGKVTGQIKARQVTLLKSAKVVADVMQESIKAAMTVVRRRARRLGVKPDFHEKRDIHIHVPEGATPKDGPSAGIAMTTAFVSALTGIPVRADVAMTGEITLRGRVLPVGGVREKVLAAHRAGLKTVILPKRNVKDLVDVPKRARTDLKIIPVEYMDQVLEVALYPEAVVQPPRPRKRPEDGQAQESDED